MRMASAGGLCGGIVKVSWRACTRLCYRSFAGKETDFEFRLQSPLPGCQLYAKSNRMSSLCLPSMRLRCKSLEPVICGQIAPKRATFPNWDAGKVAALSTTYRSMTEAEHRLNFSAHFPAGFEKGFKGN